MRFLSVLSLVLVSAPALANDGFGGISATGLTFSRTDAVAMEREDLFISVDRIAVDYTFRNLTGADVTGEVIFPLPPLPLQGLLTSDYNLPDDLTRENLLDFTITVDGQAVTPKLDRIAVIEPPWDAPRPLSAQYDTPGRDVTAVLAEYGIPLTLDTDAVVAALSALPADDRARLTAEGIADFYEGDGADIPPEVFPLWSVVLRYHWTQTFPAGAAIEVSHSYENRPTGGIFSWSHPPEDWQADYVERYCVDEGTSRAMAARLGPEGYGTAYLIDYVLRTANSWAGPIGQFRLTIDKGKAENVISLCIDGIEKTGPTTFVVEKTDFSPQDDLRILLLAPF
ncbi:MAG: hypothetical protein RIR62_2103 [Pseudomonadota bacterium]|jgi:hypothetical protein